MNINKPKPYFSPNNRLDYLIYCWFKPLSSVSGIGNAKVYYGENGSVVAIYYDRTTKNFYFDRNLLDIFNDPLDITLQSEKLDKIKNTLTHFFNLEIGRCSII
jgi:hypothetical protein